MRLLRLPGVRAGQWLLGRRLVVVDSKTQQRSLFNTVQPAQKKSSLDAAKALLRTAQKAILDEANARSIRCTNLTGGYIYFLVLATVVSVAST
mmetsp:Transcript_12002/g.39507  ORF Transcript_12002/g.39507 Transcript_12002/m.39507 type:complete len:93 (-) Transcript_12002:472-750(-)